jgi:MFS family permease
MHSSGASGLEGVAAAGRPADPNGPPRPGRNADIALLALCQALYQMGVSVDLTLTALVGLSLAPDMALATLPLTLITVVGAIGSAAVGALVPRFGYRTVMLAGATAEAIGGMTSAIAVQEHSFPLLCLGTSLVGLHKASGAYYRYQAADRARSDRRARALATVLAGGVAAALIGPFAATSSRNLLSTEFAGSYLIVAAVGVLILPLIWLLGPIGTESFRRSSARPRTGPTSTASPPGAVAPASPWRPALRTASFRDGFAALAYGGFAMTLLMAIGPMGNMAAGNTVTQGAMIIQWHMVGMFAPSWFTGRLATRYGPRRIAVAGGLVLLAGTSVGASGSAVGLLMVGLGLVGVAWNLLYVAGSSFIIRCYEQGRGSKIQSVVEGSTAGLSAIASLSASTVFEHFGWTGANLAMLVLSLAACAHFLLRRGAGQPRTATTEGNRPVKTPETAETPEVREEPAPAGDFAT